ncbi:MAG: hypothetical protein EB031_04380 [Proteobacteria bacterium]|nr:hypothetical protein [Pseudomonadota bacterium]
MNPKLFDLIILPQHDNYNYTLPNIVRIIGALNDVQSSMLHTKSAFRTNYPELPNFIAVIIGGSTKSYKFCGKLTIIISKCNFCSHWCYRKNIDACWFFITLIFTYF